MRASMTSWCLKSSNIEQQNHLYAELVSYGSNAAAATEGSLGSVREYGVRPKQLVFPLELGSMAWFSTKRIPIAYYV